MPGHAPDKMLDAMRTSWNKRPAKTSESTNVNASENVRSSVMQDVTFYYSLLLLVYSYSGA